MQAGAVEGAAADRDQAARSSQELLPAAPAEQELLRRGHVLCDAQAQAHEGVRALLHSSTVHSLAQPVSVPALLPEQDTRSVVDAHRSFFVRGQPKLLSPDNPQSIEDIIYFSFAFNIGLEAK